MNRFRRFFLAIAILLSGAALLPFVSLSREPFTWQLYSDAYVPGVVDVSIEDFAYRPSVVLVPVGTTVRWTNNDSVVHTVSSTTGLFGSGPLQPGESFEFLFDTPGDYAYLCELHPEMVGMVTVVSAVQMVYLPVIMR
jgi:plastocyanin